MADTLNLEGRAAVVTGGSRGIGLAIADALLTSGAAVTITGRSQDGLREARERLGSDAGKLDRLAALVADVRDHAQVAAMLQSGVERFGGLDILVNNAGIGVFAEVAHLQPEQWEQTIGTNLTGVYNCCHAAIPHLRRRGGGWIINISSLAGTNPFPGAAAYCASKAGLNAFSEALMQEVRYDDIRVSYLMPGSVRTEFGGTHEGVGMEWKLAAEDVARVVIDLIAHPGRSLPSRVELRPTKPRRASK